LEPVRPSADEIPRPGTDLLRQEIEALAAEWEGIVGLYLYDLESGETITLNADTVFSAASVIKVGILLHAYVTVPEFDPELQEAIKAMIIESDNLKANDVLAATVGGTGTDAAYDGVLALNDFLQELGFQHTYMNMPFEAYDYLVGIRGLSIAQGPPREGSPPYTKPDTILRTTPAEISRLFLMIEACSQGEGELLERYPEQLSAEECQEILDLLAQNADTARLVAGIPAGVRVEHKSGWTQFMHADVGFVRSPGGDYLLAVYLWRDVEELPDVWANPYIEALSRLVYTAYNPVELRTEN
jgi:beta-lactamase class A